MDQNENVAFKNFFIKVKQKKLTIFAFATIISLVEFFYFFEGLLLGIKLIYISGGKWLIFLFHFNKFKVYIFILTHSYMKRKECEHAY